jgi:tetratricopeptide (TPR) repeat protein
LKAGEWFRRGRLLMVSPVHGDHRRCQAEIPLIVLFRFPEPALWSIVEETGKKLCDCGDQAEGWDWQAESQYRSGQYLTAINFWRRSAKAQPDAQGDITAKIANAHIELDDFKMAVDQYQILSARSPEKMDYRYGYGRALIFNGQYKDAVDILRGVPSTFEDDGIRGGARIFEAAARYGYAASVETQSDREKVLGQAKNVLCTGLAESPEWKELLEGNSDEGHFSKIRELISPYFKSDCPK